MTEKKTTEYPSIRHDVKPITIDSKKNWKTDSPIGEKILEDLQKYKKINVEKLMEMKIEEIENNPKLKELTEEIRVIKKQWREFSSNLKKIKKNIEKSKK